MAWCLYIYYIVPIYVPVHPETAAPCRPFRSFLSRAIPEHRAPEGKLAHSRDGLCSHLLPLKSFEPPSCGSTIELKRLALMTHRTTVSSCTRLRENPRSKILLAFHRRDRTSLDWPLAHGQGTHIVADRPQMAPFGSRDTRTCFPTAQHLRSLGRIGKHNCKAYNS